MGRQIACRPIVEITRITSGKAMIPTNIQKWLRYTVKVRSSNSPKLSGLKSIAAMPASGEQTIFAWRTPSSPQGYYECKRAYPKRAKAQTGQSRQPLQAGARCGDCARNVLIAVRGGDEHSLELRRRKKYSLVQHRGKKARIAPRVR